MKMSIFIEKKERKNNFWVIDMKDIKRKKRNRYKLKKVSNRNRLSVFKSNNHIYAQIISDEKGVTIASASSLEKDWNQINWIAKN